MVPVLVPVRVLVLVFVLVRVLVPVSVGHISRHFESMIQKFDRGRVGSELARAEGKIGWVRNQELDLVGSVSWIFCVCAYVDVCIEGEHLSVFLRSKVTFPYYPPTLTPLALPPMCVFRIRGCTDILETI